MSADSQVPRSALGLAGAALVISIGLAVTYGGWHFGSGTDLSNVAGQGGGGPAPATVAAGRPSVTPAPTKPSAELHSGPVIRYPVKGPGRWRLATGNSAVAGRSGPLLRYRVAVEEGIAGVDANGFAGEVVATLADPRSWTAGGRWRLQRVDPSGPYDFTIHLATPATRDRLCAMGYDRYTSCRNGDRVVINVARWVHGVPRYGAPLATYRQYVVNHEVGHRLGHGHELCPGPGRSAPVMQQQTLGLHGCVAYAWPWRGGRRYAGPPGQY